MDLFSKAKSVISSCNDYRQMESMYGYIQLIGRDDSMTTSNCFKLTAIGMKKSNELLRKMFNI